MRKISIISLMQKLKWGGIGIQTGYFFPNNLIQFVNVKFWTPAKITSQNLSVSSFIFNIAKKDQSKLIL